MSTTVPAGATLYLPRSVPEFGAELQSVGESFPPLPDELQRPAASA